MVDVHVGEDQRLNAPHVETKGCGLCARRCIGTLLQTTIDQQADTVVKVKLVTRPGDTSGAAMMRKDGEFHAAAYSPGPTMKSAITSRQPFQA